MRLSLRRRALIALGLCLSFVAAGSPPAKATTYTYTGNYSPNRTKSGANLWAPLAVDFNSGWDNVAGRSWMVFGFVWKGGSGSYPREVGQGITIEINAKVDCNWARAEYETFDADAASWATGFEGYDPTGFETNIPADSGVLPYEDSIVFEPCDYNSLHPGSHTRNQGQGNFGVGLLNAQNLSTGHYYIKVAMENRDDHQSNPGYNSPVQLRVKTGVVYNANSGWTAADNADCDFNATEISNWNAATDAAGVIRQQADFCAFTDWEHEVKPFADGLYTGTNYYPGWNVNQNWNNDSFESTDSGYAYVAGNNHVVYCNNATIGHFNDGSCALEFNKGSAGFGAVSYDVAMNTAAGFMPTAEAAIRCRNGSTCLFDLGVWGLGVSGTEAVFNNGGINYEIPDDGNWYYCRMDVDHKNSGAFTGAHSTLRWQLYNYSGGNMDVDTTFLGGKTNSKDADSGFYIGPTYWYFGVGTATVGSACTMK